MKSRSPLLIVCLALALAGSGLTGWLHPAAAAQAGFDICSASGPRTSAPATNTGDPQTTHDCVYCASAPASGTAERAAAAGSTPFAEDAPGHRPFLQTAHRDRLNAEPRAPPVVA